ncbi:hypothetical protein Patl1_05206 [Pistacia atlantica]|uniref:Uncharacterized protein n=1 Tax=Pistacia atlantica TaxID=434234 RepID=A0ACC1BWI6_9ROSI|nr:hypothetical protein Patl1_05206 [Pistacia atlantica]
MWWDIIDKAKDGGLNLIQTYVFWSLNDPVQAQYNFEGICNLTQAKKTEEHGHHDHESYYGDRDTDDGRVSCIIPREGPQKLALEDKSKNSAENAERSAPKAGRCRIEGYVPGNLIISARSGAHSFDTSQMNMSYVITHLSFGQLLSPKVMSDVWLIELL